MMPFRSLCNFVLLIALLVSTMASIVEAQEWTRFRGPNGTGVGVAKDIPAKWTDDDYLWKVKLAGIGHASPILWGDRVFIVSGDTETGDQLVNCLSTTGGRLLWQKRLKSAHHHLHSRNSFSSSTPTVDKEHLYVSWSSPEEISVIALTHEGKEVWRTGLGPFVSSHGWGTSPMIYKDMIVIGNHQQKEGPRGGFGKSFNVAIDKHSGGIRWKVDRPIRRVGYSTPCVYQPAQGDPQLIFNSGANGMTGVNPDTGDILWNIFLFDKRSVSSPVIYRNLIFGSCGSGGGGNYIVAVDPGNGKDVEPKIKYKIDKAAPYVPTLVLNGDLAFLWYDKGIVTCIDAGTGEQHWQKRVGGGYSGSPIRIGDRLYCLSDEGECVVLSATKEYKLLGRMDLGDICRSTPAVAGDRLYLRSQSTLFCLGPK